MNLNIGMIGTGNVSTLVVYRVMKKKVRKKEAEEVEPPFLDLTNVCKNVVNLFIFPINPVDLVAKK